MCVLDKNTENIFGDANIDFICVYIYNELNLKKQTFFALQGESKNKMVHKFCAPFLKEQR